MVVSEASARILDAAGKLFAERGYQATTTKAIARQAEANEVTLFRAFGSKSGLLSALGRRIAEHQAGLAAAAVPVDDDVRTTLLGFARMEVDAAMADGGLVARLAFEASSVPEVAEVLGARAPANLEGLSSYVKQRQASGEIRSDLPAEIIAEGFLGLTSSYVIMRTVFGLGATGDGGVSVEQLFELFWSGASAAKS